MSMWPLYRSAREIQAEGEDSQLKVARFIARSIHYSSSHQWKPLYPSILRISYVERDDSTIIKTAKLLSTIYSYRPCLAGRPRRCPVLQSTLSTALA